MKLSQPNVHIFTSFDDAEQLWRRLETAGDAYVYQTYDWLKEWHQLVGANREIELCFAGVIDDDDEPLMFLPLAIERHRLWKVLTWLGASFSDYNSPILAPNAAARLERIGDMQDIWRMLRQRLPRFDYAHFERLPASIGGQTNPMAHLNSIEHSHAAHSTRLIGDWQSYYTGKRGKRTRHNDRRKRRKLENQGHLEFVIARTPADVSLLVPAMLRQKRAYVRALGKRSVLDEPGYDAFLRTRAEDGLTTGETMLCGLKLGEDILAVQWGAVYGKRLYSIIASYDDGEHSSLSPGEVLLHELFGWCFDQGIEVFDFTYGDEPYKQAWCEETLPLYQSLMPASPWGTLGVHALKSGIKMKNQLKDTAYVRQLLSARHYLRGKSGGEPSRQRSSSGQE